MTRDRAAALVLLLFGVAGTIEASRLTIGGPVRPGPGFFPLWLALALSIVAAALLVRPAPAAGAGRPTAGVRHGKVALALAAGALYAALLEPLGFGTTTVLFLLFLLRAVEPRRWRSSIVIAAATALVCQIVFKTWLDVQLPAGPWGF